MQAMSLLDPNTMVSVPTVSGRFLTLDLVKIVAAEARIDEIATFSASKGPELLATFNLSWKDLQGNLVVLEREKTIWERELNRHRANLMLTVVPEKLKAMGLTSGKSPLGSEDLRTAVITTDAEYIVLEDRLHEITAITELVRGKMKAFEMAYNSVKRLLQDINFTHK